jgi:ABC-type uncharacterized transport system substrate-binding protein
LVGLRPDIIVVIGSTPGTIALQRETRTIPIVFANVAEPIAGNLAIIGSNMAENCPMFSRLGAMHVEQN